ncbi:stress-associated endoplasmic reticulum protein 2 isoform X1 [Etheostoma spectabile]|uniref:stress-associated endoplasmic reticulum protein 2 isoform X1 n=1 Tax=Etheostoma spectabile TaxID=54343 RepID=UPI0013AF33CA|nr:stress-associated endoplasmic reticulum protein 2 isoform X1 [Etheostoma spectabile]
MTLAQIGDVHSATTRGEVSCGSLAACTLCICCVWISHISDHPEHPNGDVRQKKRPDSLTPPSLPSLSLASLHLHTPDPFQRPRD